MILRSRVSAVRIKVPAGTHSVQGMCARFHNLHGDSINRITPTQPEHFNVLPVCQLSAPTAPSARYLITVTAPISIDFTDIWIQSFRQFSAHQKLLVYIYITSMDPV